MKYIPILIGHIISWNSADIRMHSFEQAGKQASLFAKNNIMTILIQDVNNTMAGYQKEILPSSWSPIVKYSVYNINSEEKKALMMYRNHIFSVART